MLDARRSRSISVVVPILNERKNLAFLLRNLENIGAEQLIIVDGGSNDGSHEWLNQHWVQHERHQIPDQQRFLVISNAGRSTQMNAGGKIARGDLIVFLHADTRLPDNAAQEMADARDQNYFWGRFDVQFEPSSKGFLFNYSMSVIALFINIRSRLTSIATGDQAIFVDRALFHSSGGFPNQALMEDVEFCKTLKQQRIPFCSELKVHTSARRWQQRGIVKTVVLMWWLRLAYFLGSSPQKLAKIYRQIR